MKSLWLILSFVALLSFAGCETGLNGSKIYRRVTVTNPRGELISEWVAVGHVWRTGDNGYRFRALERVSGPPHMQIARYPDGRVVDINGPNIHITECGAPVWYYEHDQGGK